MVAQRSPNRLLLATLVVAVAALVVVKSPARVESREPGSRGTATDIQPIPGWERAFPRLAVGP
jgi:hypothetical protein